MAEDDKIRYSDIIQPDDSIERLITQLNELNKQYGTTVDAIKSGADRIVSALKSASGATSEGRKSIDEAAEATSRLERAQRELEIALSDTGKEIAWIKAQTKDINKASVEQHRYINQAVSSYDRLKTDLKETVELYKSLSAAERADSEMGQQLLNDIVNLKNQVKALDDQMKPHIQTLTEVEKAEQRLAYLQSDEGQRLLDLKAKIAAVTSARKQHKAVIDPVVQAQEKLVYAQSEENQQLKLYSTKIAEANRIAQLQAQIANSAEGSYDRLSAQYALNKIRLNQMSAAEREAVDSGKKLEGQTLEIYKQMMKLQEATGNYRLSVGKYTRVWEGLGVSISQVVRELPSLAISANTFFLAISNNIPMVADEIRRLRLQNKLLQAEGKPTISITKKIVQALLSWNTVLVVMLTVLSTFGGKIIEWAKSLIHGKNAVISTTKALNSIAKELEKTNADFGSSVVTVKQLQKEWQGLKSTAEKNQWIADNKSEFDKLGISVNSVTDAENIFINNTQAVIEALKLRAKAAAAQKLAEEQYEKALVKRNEAETAEAQGPSAIDKSKLAFVQAFAQGPAESPEFLPGTMSIASQVEVEDFRKKRIQGLKDEADAAEKNGDAYFNMANGYEEAAKAMLDAAEIQAKHKKLKKPKTPKTPKSRDLTDTINKNDIIIQRKYEESITELQKDEYAKRRKAAADDVQNENNKLREMYRKNEEYVNNVNKKYNKLTKSQKEQIAKQQQWITDTIANNLKRLDLQLLAIENEYKAQAAKSQRETINAKAVSGTLSPVASTGIQITQKTSDIEKSLVKERDLVAKNLEIEYKLIRESNAELLKANDKHARSEEEILAEYQRKKLDIYAKYDTQILSLRKQNIEDRIALIKKGTEDEINLLLEQNEIERQLALAANLAKPAAEQVSTSVINAKYDKSAAQITGAFDLRQLDEQQALSEAIFYEVERSEKKITKFKLEQEKARWEKQILLAEAGALEWSQAQIDAAKASVKGIDNQLKKLKNFIGSIGEEGLGGSLLEKLGFNDTQTEALKNATSTVIDYLKEIAAAEVELAEKAVEAAEKRVDASKSAYEAEVEGRNNGYANNVASAKKEYELEKKNLQQKQKLLQQAQRRQEALNTVVQTSSLITASANLWSAFSSVPIVGPALALAAIASMWTSFAIAKVKAKQVTAVQEYGEGGLEFLEGGSHASGNDIDLGVSNKNRKRMHAEGGEALAIINKRRARKYRKVLPDVIDSFNKGIFEDKYTRAFDSANGIRVAINSNDSIDLSKLEADVHGIKRQNETKYYTMPNGTMIIQHKNVKRIIRN